MGKKRISSSILTKIHASSSSSSSSSVHAPSNQRRNQSELSVTDRLSQLRLEDIRHERNASKAGPTSLAEIQGSTRGDREISDLLGHTYVQPAPRIKLRNSGHRAPRSWQTPSHGRRSQQAVGSPSERFEGTLSARCLNRIACSIEQYLGCGMQFLPGYLKSQLLSDVHNVTQTLLEDIWSDLLSPDIGDESVTSIDLHRAQLPKISTLKRLEALHTVVVSSMQFDRGIILALPSVLQDLTIVEDISLETTASQQQARQISWRKVSRHLVAVRKIQIQYTFTKDDIDTARSLVALIELLESSVQWEAVFDTLKLIVFHCARSTHLTLPEVTKAIRSLQESLRHQRRLGRHIEIRCSKTVGE